MHVQAKPLFVLILFFLLSLTPSLLAGTPFSLDEVSELFPSEDFVHEIAFWKMVFTEYDTRSVLFHDVDDLRLIYHIETFQKDIEGNTREAKRQREYLKRKSKDLKKLFDEIARLGVSSSRLGAGHRRIIDALRENGYEITPTELRKRQENFRYQRGVSNKFRKSLIRSGLYVTEIEEAFREKGLPTELAMLPHVESSFDYNAYSKAGAAGIWQFTRGTGKSYLRINRFIDERLDPIRASEAAANLFKDNYEALASWPITITSYNHGRYGMIRAKKQFGTDLRKIVDNYRSKYFGFASKNFYAEFLAALDVARNHKIHFGELAIESPLEYATIRLQNSYDTSILRSVPELDVETLSHYNPHLARLIQSSRRHVIPAGTQVRIPPEFEISLTTVLASAQPAQGEVMVASDGSVRYRVQYGDALSQIASQFGTSNRTIQQLNGISNPNRIFPGQVLLVSRGDNRSVAVQSSREETSATKPSTYVVKRGDNLSTLAARFGTSVKEILRVNNLSNPNRIRPGQRLLIYAHGQAPREYVIRQGDTLEQIALRFGSSIDEIQDVNGIQNPHRIQQGQQILIP